MGEVKAVAHSADENEVFLSKKNGENIQYEDAIYDVK
jgi:hypothetical protein